MLIIVHPVPGQEERVVRLSPTCSQTLTTLPVPLWMNAIGP